jgi:hypothetical protein
MQIKSDFNTNEEGCQMSDSSKEIPWLPGNR